MLSEGKLFQKTKIKKRAPSAVNARWSDAQKLEAAQLYLMVGSNATVCAALGIPIQTFNHWKVTKWWKDLIEDLRHEGQIKLSNRLKNIAMKSFDLVEDRLENGDYIYDQKSGELRRKPMLGKDAARIASDFVDKAIKLDSNPREEEAAVLTRLEDLATEFKKLAQKKTPVLVTDVITITE